MMMRIVKLKDELIEIEDYKKFVKPYLDNALNFIGTKCSLNRKIQHAFTERVLAIYKQINNNGAFKGETCIFDVIFDAIDNKTDAVCYLEFINRCLGKIREKLPRELYSSFLKTIEGLFTDFDDKKSRYRSRVGEIAVLSQLLNRDELILKDIEYKLPNGRTIDYVVEYQSEKFYFEVFNVLNFDSTRINSSKDLVRFLETRYQKKVNDKLNRLDLNQYKNFSLIFVIWGDLECFQLYSDVLMDLKKFNGLIFPPLGIFLVTDKVGRKKYIINSIEKVIRQD